METLSKNMLHQLRRYLQKKVRRTEHKCLIEGEKLCWEALTNGISIETVVYTRGGGEHLHKLLQHPGVKKSYAAPPELICLLSEVTTPQGIVGLIAFPVPLFYPGERANHRRYIALDAIADPGNVRTIIRTASWYGLDGVLCGNDTAEIANGKVIRSSMGAVFHLPIWEQITLIETLSALKKRGFTIFGSTPHNGINEITSLPEKIVLVIGSEAIGISLEIAQLCDTILTIEGYGKAESLNAAVCAGILLDRLHNKIHK
jgi:TrmH family RNA methyltransferase